MAVERLFALAAFAVVATITPGGATTLATSSGAHVGLRRSVPVLGGMAATLAVMAAAAGAGLAGLLVGAPAVGLLLKVAGSVYLLWLALRIARSGAPDAVSGDGRRLGFGQGVALTLGNPKAWAMTTAMAASFAGLLTDPIGLAALFGVTFAVAAGVSLTLWCSFGVVLRRLVRTDRQWHGVNGLLALLLVASIALIWA